MSEATNFLTSPCLISFLGQSKRLSKEKMNVEEWDKQGLRSSVRISPVPSPRAGLWR